MAIEINTLIKAIAASLVIVAVILIAGIWFQPLYAEFSEKLTPEAEEEFTTNFDLLINNIEECLLVEDDNCLCDGFEPFPAFLPVKSKIIIKEMQDKNTQINWTYNKQTYKSEIIQNLKISAIYFNTRQEIPYLSDKTIDFSKEPPEFKQTGLTKRMPIRKYYPRIISKKIYKKNNELFFIIWYPEYERSTFPDPDLKICGEEQEE